MNDKGIGYRGVISNPTPVGIGIAVAKQLFKLDIMGEVEEQIANTRQIQLHEEDRHKEIASIDKQSREADIKKLQSKHRTVFNNPELKLSSKISVLTSSKIEVPNKYRWSNYKSPQKKYKPIVSDPYHSGEPLKVKLKFPETDLHKAFFKQDGHLQEELIALLSVAYNYRVEALKESIWQHYGKTFKGEVWFHNTNYPNASVMGKYVYFSTEQLIMDFNSWFNLISHEESHRQDIYNSSNFEFYLKYLIEGSYKEYEKISTEQKAYLNGAGRNRGISSLADELISFKKGVIKNTLLSKDISKNEKIKTLKKVGLEFKLMKLEEELSNFKSLENNLTNKLKNFNLDSDDIRSINNNLNTVKLLKNLIVKEIDKLKTLLKKS